MEMRKRGTYFTLMTIAFLVIFLFVLLMPGYRKIGEKMMVVEMRVDSMNNFIKDLERDIERGLYIASYRAILSLEENIIIRGEFLNDTKSSFEEAILYGTVNGTNSSIMVASTFPEWIGRIQEESSKFNVEFNITLNDIDVYQTDPWHVKVSADVNFSVEDVTGIASWNRVQSVETSVSILEFEDPLYIVNSFGRTTNVINKTSFEGNFTYKIGGEWNVSNLLTHAHNSYYLANTDAPSFLMRFEDDLSSSPYGIESLVNLKKLGDYGLEIDEHASIVDYHYWNGGSDGDYRVNFTPSWFRLDNDHLEIYNVANISYVE